MVMKLCKQCIEELKSRGEKFNIASDSMCDAEESKLENEPCDWCGEFDELWFCWSRN